MLEQENKTKTIISAIASPFATASMVLLILLSLIEYFRRGFVSLFLDFRLLAAVALILWLAAVTTEPPPRRRRLALILPTLALLAATPILYKMTLPFGRLGLVVFGTGVITIIFIIVATANSDRGSHTMDNIQ
jgi:hypothetical protein